MAEDPIGQKRVMFFGAATGFLSVPHVKAKQLTACCSGACVLVVDVVW